MELAELGQGFHLIPVREHCRVQAVYVPSDADWDAAWDLLWDKGLAGNCYAAREAIDAFIQQRREAHYGKAKERRAKLARIAPQMCDPMAIQSTMILRGVLRELREGA